MVNFFSHPQVTINHLRKSIAKWLIFQPSALFDANHFEGNSCKWLTFFLHLPARVNHFGKKSAKWFTFVSQVLNDANHFNKNPTGWLISTLRQFCIR